MRFSARRILILSTFVITLQSVPAFAGRLDDARRDMARLRYDEAESALVDIARSARGGDKQEALYLLAGLKKTIPEAEIIYQEVIRIDTDNRWAIAADIELAKIQYALGNYDNVLEILDSSSACGSSDEACYFEGLSAVMLKRYEIAKEKLSKVKSGKYRPVVNQSRGDVPLRGMSRTAGGGGGRG
jgi:tetratricopeptide (TPR) repeat protein